MVTIRNDRDYIAYQNYRVGVLLKYVMIPQFLRYKAFRVATQNF